MNINAEEQLMYQVMKAIFDRCKPTCRSDKDI